MRAGPHAADTINHPCTCTFAHAWASHTVSRHHHRSFRRWVRTHKSPLPPDGKREATVIPTGNCHSHRHVTGKDLTVDLSSPQIWKDLEFLHSQRVMSICSHAPWDFGAVTHSQCFPRLKDHLQCFSVLGRVTPGRQFCCVSHRSILHNH